MRKESYMSIPILRTQIVEWKMKRREKKRNEKKCEKKAKSRSMVFQTQVREFTDFYKRNEHASHDTRIAHSTPTDYKTLEHRHKKLCKKTVFFVRNNSNCQYMLFGSRWSKKVHVEHTRLELDLFIMVLDYISELGRIYKQQKAITQLINISVRSIPFRSILFHAVQFRSAQFYHFEL